MLNNKRYLQILFFIFTLIGITTFSYAYYFSKEYPLPITSRISFDAKIKFIREKIDTKKIDTIIVGSSIGMNNVQGAYLEKASSHVKHALNLSVYEASALQVEQLLELIDAFPHLKRVIYSAQFSDFQHLSTFKNYHPKTLVKYITHTLNPLKEAKLIFDASKDLPFLAKRKKEWAHKHGRSNDFSYLGFDHTGSVPLHIYGKDIIKRRWENPHAAVQLPKAFDALFRIAKKMHQKGIKFYFIHQPYRQALVEKDPMVKIVIKKFSKNLNVLISKDGGYFLSLHDTLHLEDKYFADRSHLNDKGSIITSEAIGKFIDKSEGK
ncbi:MAG: hypothetical protein DSZ08_04840 [Sulfurovum sp.]|nr:MAG: hypothetical protein DSZ08_04840 [Sulfurovum sp.]